MTVVEKLRNLEAKATPGPWTPSTDEPGDVVLWGPTEEWMANIGNWARQRDGELDPTSTARQFCEFRDAADAELMAAMRDALPALLELVKAAKGVLVSDGGFYGDLRVALEKLGE